MNLVSHLAFYIVNIYFSSFESDSADAGVHIVDSSTTLWIHRNIYN